MGAAACRGMLVLCSWLSLCGAVGAATASGTWQVGAQDVASLREALLSILTTHLAPHGLSLEREHAWLDVAGALPPTGLLEVRAATPLDVLPLPMPLTFHIRPASDRAAADPPLQARLAVTLQQEVWTAARRLRKGSRVTCADLSLQRRRVQSLPQRALLRSCDFAANAVALRELGSGDVVRDADIGKAPEVMAATAVLLHVTTGGIDVAITATALADGRTGDRIDVRLQRPARTLPARVIAPGTVQLLESSP